MAGIRRRPSAFGLRQLSNHDPTEKKIQFPTCLKNNLKKTRRRCLRFLRSRYRREYSNIRFEILWESKWRILRESDIYLFYTKKLFVVLIVIFTIFNFSKIETNIVFQFHRRFTEV